MHQWACFQDTLRSSLGKGLLADMAGALLKGDGKKLRPQLVFHCAHLCEYRGSDHIGLAQCIEYIHTASLLHDDVLDNGQQRHGMICLHHQWGTNETVLAGDFLLVKGLDALIRIKNWDLLKAVQKATQEMLFGQIQERTITLTTPLKTYLSMIENKTAVFFALACQGAALLAQSSEAIRRILFQYGIWVGLCYQLLDDLADYEQPVNQWGQGHDFIEKKITFPLLLAYRGKDVQLREALVCGQPHSLGWIQERLQPYLLETQTCVREYERKARHLLLRHWSASKVMPFLEFHEKWLCPRDRVSSLAG